MTPDGSGDLRSNDPGHPLETQHSAVVKGADGPEPERGAHEEARLRPMTMFRGGAYVSMGALAVFAAAAAVYTTRAVLVRVLIAVFEAVSLDPAVRMLTRWGMRRGLAVLLIFVIAGGLVAAFLVPVTPAMVHQFPGLVHDFPGYLVNLEERSARFRGLCGRFHLTSRVQGPASEPPRPARERAARVHPPPVRRFSRHSRWWCSPSPLSARWCRCAEVWDLSMR
jgi:AI-2E family transporter